MKDIEELKKEYELIRKKFNLPSFEYLDEEFEIRALEINKSGILLKALLRIILSKIGLFLNYLDPVVSPNPQSYHSMVELNNISNEDKQKMTSYYRTLSYLYHEGCAVELKSENHTAEFIKNISEKWPSLKKEESAYLDKITKAWVAEKQTEKSSYTG